MVKDLRSSHFPIGFEGPTYTSEQKSNYTAKPFQAVSVPTNGRENHIKFDKDIEYKTMNNIYFDKKGGAKE